MRRKEGDVRRVEGTRRREEVDGKREEVKREEGTVRMVEEEVKNVEGGVRVEENESPAVTDADISRMKAIKRSLPLWREVSIVVADATQGLAAQTLPMSFDLNTKVNPLVQT